MLFLTICHSLMYRYGPIPSHHCHGRHQYSNTCGSGGAYLQQRRHGRSDGYHQPWERKILHHLRRKPLRFCHDRLGMGRQQNYRCPREYTCFEARPHQARSDWLLSQWQRRPRCWSIRTPYRSHHTSGIRFGRRRMLACLGRNACRWNEHSDCL